MRRSTALPAAVATLVLVTGASYAGASPAAPEHHGRAAAFPGSNGRIVFDAFPSSTSSYEEIYIANADGSNVQRLTTNNGRRISDVHPDWSPNGRKIVFARDGALVIINAHGDVLDHISVEGAAQPAWAPTGDKIAFWHFTSTGAQIDVVDVSSGTVTHMTDPPAGESDHSPEWAPDGSAIVFTRERSSGDVDLMTVDVQNAPFGPGAEHRLIHHSGTYCSYPDWSPDGHRIAFSRNSTADHDADIFTYTVANGAVHRVTQNSGISDYMPAYSPDGRQLVWARGDSRAQVTDDLVVRNLRTGATTVITPNPDRLDAFPDWGPRP